MPTQNLQKRQRMLWGMIVVLLIAIVLLSRTGQTPKPPEPASAASDIELPSIKATESELKPAANPAPLAIKHWQTKDGARVYFINAPELPMVDIRLVFAAGSARDGKTPGLAQMTNALMAEGTDKLNADQIASGFADLGANFGSGSYRDMAVLSLRSLVEPKLLDPAVSLFTDILAHPAFRAPAVERVRNQILAYITYQKQRPSTQAKQAFYQALYKDQPYGHPSIGTSASIRAITPDQLRAFHQQYYSARNMVIAIVGDMDRSKAEALAEEISASIPAGQAAPPVEKPEPLPEAVTTHLSMPASQTSIFMGELGITRHNPDYPALYLGNQILGGGGLTSRLMEQVREKRGLTYGVYSTFIPMQAAGPFTISLQTRNGQAELAQSVVKETLAKFIAEGPTEQELTEAKRNILGSYPMSIASNAGLVNQLGAIGFYNQPLDQMQQFLAKINTLTTTQVKEAMARHIDPNKLIEITAGPASVPSKK